MANLNQGAAESAGNSNSSNLNTATGTTDLKSNACRRLNFGDETIDQETLYQLQNEDGQKATKKWNFDFENEVPLPGDWEWEKVPVNVPDNKEVIANMESDKEKNRNV